jgi:O-succinylbenzoic acid--CoA ligase
MLLSAKKTLDYLGLKENQNALLCLPAAYVAGKMMLVRAIYGGLNIFSIAPKIKLEVPETEIHLAAFIPLQMEELLNRDFDFSPIKNTIIGGAAIPANLENRIAVLPNAFYATYGMTETITHIALQKLNGVHKTEFYTVLPGIKISVDEQNRLQIASPYSDEILQTNDIVHLQSENTFIWLGRTDNVINSGGLKIFPETLEKKLSEFIRDEFFVYGIEDEKLGQKLVLFIQTEKQENSFNSIVEQLKVELGKNEIPKQIILLKQFRYTENNKIQRNETAQQLNSGIRIFLA